MAKIPRRGMLKSSTAIAAGSAGLGTEGHPGQAADRAGRKYNWGHTIDFGEQYYLRIKEILANIQRTETAKIGAISSRMAEALGKGGNVWYHAHEGHMCYLEFDMANKGNPGIIMSHTNKSDGDFVRMQAGDVLVTNFVNSQVKDVRDKGVYVVGVPTNYVDNEWIPRGFIQPNENNWMLADVTSEILQSYIPYHQGIVDCPEIPEMKICPSSANSLASLFWMFQCAVAAKLKDKNAKKADKSAAFMETILSRLDDAYRRQKDCMFDHAPTVAKKIGGGARYHVTSDHPGVQSEATGVAMGPMMTNAFRDDMKKGDVHLLTSIEPDSQKIIEEAKKARALGMFVVAIAPGCFRALRQYSDVFIDNLCPEGGGLMEIKGCDKKVGSIGGIMNNILMWIFTAQFVDEMIRRGWVPWFWMGIRNIGGREYNNTVRPFFLKRGF